MSFFKLPEVTGLGFPTGAFNFLNRLKSQVEIWGGQKTSRIATYQDLIDLGLIDSDGNRLDDSGNPI